MRVADLQWRSPDLGSAACPAQAAPAAARPGGGGPTLVNQDKARGIEVWFLGCSLGFEAARSGLSGALASTAWLGAGRTDGAESCGQALGLDHLRTDFPAHGYLRGTEQWADDLWHWWILGKRPVRTACRSDKVGA